MRNLTCRRLQVDEIWTFNYCKQRNVTADTKHVPCVRLGARTASDANEFMEDLASRLTHRVQLTTDGFRPYLSAVDMAFGGGVDYATLTKWYGAEMPRERRYSPPVVVSTVKTVVNGNPGPAHISTSYVERQNWTLRTTMRRYTRLSNRFNRKVENHMAAVALNYFVYNFCKIHSTLRTTPAMATGVSARLLDISDLVALLIESESKAA